MFYRMISQKRDEWFASPDCTIARQISYMEANGQLRMTIPDKPKSTNQQ